VTLTLAEHGSSTRARQSHVPGSGGAAGFAQVLALVDRGFTAERVASVLGVSDEVVGLALEHAERLGLVVLPGAAAAPCGTGCATAALKPAACAGCPLAR